MTLDPLERSRIRCTEICYTLRLVSSRSNPASTETTCKYHSAVDMCWKTSQSVPEPNPAMSLSVTEEPQLEGVLSCPQTAHSCNSTDCFGNGLVCCLKHEPKTPFCVCFNGWEPPKCVYESFFGESRGQDMGSAGIAGIIAFIVIAVLAIVITAVVLVIIRRRRLRQGEGNEVVALSSTENPKHAHGDQVRGATGSDGNGS